MHRPEPDRAFELSRVPSELPQIVVVRTGGDSLEAVCGLIGTRLMVVPELERDHRCGAHRRSILRALNRKRLRRYAEEVMRDLGELPGPGFERG